MTLSKYIDLYIQQIFSGARQTDKGSNFAYGTAEHDRIDAYDINWQTGEIVSLFDYTLPMLNDEIVVLYDLIVTDSLRRSVIPVALNGQEGYLLVTQTPAKPGWTVVGFSTGYNANGMPDRGITRPQAGDVIAPLYPAYYLTDDDMEEFQVEGDGFTVGADGLTLSFESMAGEGEALTYYYAFLFTDIYGETDMSDFVILEM